MKIKNDPKYIAAARELKDRWLEAVNANPDIIQSTGKYDLTRVIDQTKRSCAPLLDAA